MTTKTPHCRLVVSSGPQEGKAFALNHAPTEIGNDPSCNVRLDGLAPKHARLSMLDAETWLLSTESDEHLIRHDGSEVRELRLTDGTEFTLGSRTFRFATPSMTIERVPVSDIGYANTEEAVEELRRAHEMITRQLGEIVIGQERVIIQILTALFARGHCLLIGVPGLAKTLIVRALGGSLDLRSRRIQFTPDLMPTDITGTTILEEDPVTRQRSFRFNPGPIFTNLLLADEINRTPPKTQAALLEAMQERAVTTGGHTHDLPNPFFVVATQNPIEQEGTYPLPEAELDRFMFCVLLDYPEESDEVRVLTETTRDQEKSVDRVLDADAIMRFQYLIRQTPVSEHVAAYAGRLIRASRPNDPSAPDFVQRWVRYGAGTRAGQYLLLAAKAHVVLNGRFNVACADVREFALPVLRHRVMCNFTAASEGITSDEIVSRILETVDEPEY